MKVKVIKPVYNLNIGDELVYNNSNQWYEYAFTDKEVTKDYTSNIHKEVSFSEEWVNAMIPDYFEQIDESITHFDINQYKYIKPIVFKAYFHNKENRDQVALMGVDKSVVKIDREVFDKLFKVIE